MFFKILSVGWIILVTAILLNIAASKLSVDTWYPFLNEVSKTGFLKAFSKSSLLSKLFLFIIYPGLLGLVAFFSLRSFK